SPAVRADNAGGAAERIPVTQRTEPQRIRRWIVGRGGIHRRAAASAGGMGPAGAAVGDFYLRSRLAGEDAEALGRRGDVGAERRAGEHLAIAAVADVDAAWL